MQLITLGSGSSGNGYIIQNDDEALIIECGIPLKDAVEALGGNLKKVVGCLITHSHGDHAGFIRQYARPFNIFAHRGLNGFILGLQSIMFGIQRFDFVFIFLIFC